MKPRTAIILVTALAIAFGALAVTIWVGFWDMPRDDETGKRKAKDTESLARHDTDNRMTRILNALKGKGKAEDVESLSQYGISDRTTRILNALGGKKINLICVYLPIKGKDGAEDKPNEHHDEIWEYIEGLKKMMGREGTTIKIVDVTMSVEREKLQARFRQRHRKAHSAHVKLLEEGFLRNSAEMIKALRAAETRWGELPDDSFLGKFGLSTVVAETFGASARRLDEIVKAIRDAEADMSALPDYAGLTSQLTDSLDRTGKNMDMIVKVVKQVKGIPAPVAKSRADVVAAMAAAGEAVDAMTKTLDGVKEGTIKPAQAAAVLKAFAKACPLAAEAIRVASDKLHLAAGKDNSGIIRGCAYFTMSVRVLQSNGKFTPVSGNLVANLEKTIAPNLANLTAVAGETEKRLKPEAQLESLKGIESHASHWAGQFAKVRARAGEALTGLASPDKATAVVFKEIDDGELFRDLMDPVKALLDTARKLPDVEGAGLSSAINENNIVIVEVGQETKVATYDEVFPRQQRLSDRDPGKATGKRTFKGDSAIASKMLKTAFAPFGTVIVTYFDPPPLKMGNRPMPRAPLPIAPNQLVQLSKAIVAANFKVEQWNLADAKSRPKTDDALPTVLMVLPPPVASPFAAQMGMPSPKFGDAQLARIRKEIDSGTPAVFLATYQPVRMVATGFSKMPVPPNLEINKYLIETWGIEIVNDARLIVGNPDETTPGSFKINVEAFAYLPISTFTDHAIGRPLRGQRVFWLDACPIARASKKKDGVEIEPVLTVPESMTNIWATKVKIPDLVEAIQSGRGGLIRPSYDKGDVRSPMDLAVAAVRKADPQANRAESRVVVLAVGASMLDMYLTRRIGVSDGKGGFSFDPPPTLNTTLVVNSLYWLTGKTDFIAAGPAAGKLIDITGTVHETVLKVMSPAELPGDRDDRRGPGDALPETAGQSDDSRNDLIWSGATTV